VADLNGDGFPDLLLGNLGLNSKFNASVTYPLKMYVGDFMGNQQISHILAVEKKGKYYTFLDKEKIEVELPYLKKEYLSYSKMAGKTVEEIFGDKLNTIPLYHLSTLASVALINDRKGKFTVVEVPYQMQWTSIATFAFDDFNGDGKPDILSGGNFYGTPPFEGRYDALPLGLFTGDSKGGFTMELPLREPLDTINGEVRSLQTIKLANGKKAVIVGFNNAPLKLLQY